MGPCVNLDVPALPDAVANRGGSICCLGPLCAAVRRGTAVGQKGVDSAARGRAGMGAHMHVHAHVCRLARTWPYAKTHRHTSATRHSRAHTCARAHTFTHVDTCVQIARVRMQTHAHEQERMCVRSIQLQIRTSTHFPYTPRTRATTIRQPRTHVPPKCTCESARAQKRTCTRAHGPTCTFTRAGSCTSTRARRHAQWHADPPWYVQTRARTDRDRDRDADADANDDARAHIYICIYLYIPTHPHTHTHACADPDR